MKERRPVHKRVEPGGAAGFHTERRALAEDVRKLCIQRLADVGLDWARHEETTQKRAKAIWARPSLQEGKGRRPDRRAMLAAELDRKSWFGNRVAPSPTDVACIWLLVEGIAYVRGVAHSLDAVAVLEIEVEAFKKARARHGQRKGVPVVIHRSAARPTRRGLGQ